MKEKKLNREWVKTFAIIFLAVLLVLTFFSNTIMNMTLPEVSTQYIQYGTIRTQVRGNGTVLAADSYSVTTSATREVLKVAVRQGDEVKKGDVLMYLSEADSDELQAAKDTYDNLNYEYTKMLIEGSGNKDIEEKQLELTQTQDDLEQTKQRLSELSEIKARLDAAKAEVKAAERAVSKKESEISTLESEKSALGYTPTQEEIILGRDSDVTLEQYTQASNRIDAADEKIDEAKKSLSVLKERSNTAKAEYDNIKREYDEIAADIETPLSTLEESIKTSEREIEALDRDIKYIKQNVYENKHNKELENVYEDFTDVQDSYRKAKKEYEEILNDPTATESEKENAQRRYLSAKAALEAAFEEYDSVLTDKEQVINELEKQLAEKEITLKYALEDNTELKKKLVETKALDEKLKAKKTLLDEAETVYYDAQAKVDTAQAVYDNAVEEKEILEKQLEKTRNGYKYIVYKDYENKIDASKTELETLKSVLEEKNELLTEINGENTDTESALKEQIKTYERKIVSIRKDIETALKESGNSEKLNALELSRKKAELDKAALAVAKLEKEYTSTEIVSPVDGVIDSVNIVSGKKTTPDQSLVDISLAENGYKMTMSVTQEQAAKLRPGVQAEITSYIPYDSEVTVTLTSIKNDTANPQSRQKILEFSIDGDVTPNQTLSIAVGDKNASYENTVPNTAIREDSDGKYILIVDSKSTPISTRYIAKRVGVTVVASDDTRSAITGDFTSYSYVIATSSKPINDKEQVRLVES